MSHRSCASGIMLVLSLLNLSTVSIAADNAPTVLTANQALGNRPIAFTKNMGQWPDSILFRADIGEAVMWIVRDGIYYQFFKRIAADAPHSSEGPSMPHSGEGRNPDTDSIITDMIKAQFVGANPDVAVVGLEELDYKCNYFLGNDPTKWRADVPNYSGITFQELYPGVDASFGELEGRLEYQLSAVSDADLAQVRTAYVSDGAVTDGSTNTISIQTVFGEKRFAGILPLDETEPAKAAISSMQSPNAGVSLLYSTYLGGGSNDYGYDIAVDGSGNAYVSGFTVSTDFPTQIPYQLTYQGISDVFVTKISATGNSLLYSTYLGGGLSDEGHGIAVDGSGNAYVTGETWSNNFPTQNAYQMHQGSPDVFVTKLSPAGNNLLYSTYLGGGSGDYGRDIAVDSVGNAFVMGETGSTDFPTQNPYQTLQSPFDIFVTKFTAAGNSLVFSTYLGGGGSEYGRSITVDGSGNAYVTGETESTDFPTQNPYQSDPSDNNSDVFVTKLSSSGSSLVYSTYLGGDSYDLGQGITVDTSGNAYVAGYTNSSNFPTHSSYQTDQGGMDAFVTKFSTTGSSLVYSTYLGGGSYDQAFDIAVDSSGNVYVTGSTGSTDFPTQYPCQTNQASDDVFVTKLSASGSSLDYSTYLGGASYLEVGYGIAVDGGGNVYLTGWTLSSDFPTMSPYQMDQGGIDAFVAKLSLLPACCLPDSKLRGDVSICGGACPDGDGITDGSDLQVYVDLVFFNVFLDINPDVFTEAGPGPCPTIGDVDNSGSVDGGDLGIIVDFVFFNDTSVIVRCDGSPF